MHFNQEKVNNILRLNYPLKKIYIKYTIVKKSLSLVFCQRVYNHGIENLYGSHVQFC